MYETINDGVMAVFKWIDGVNIKNDDTKVIEYSLLCETYKVSQMGFNIPTINYSNAQVESFLVNMKV